MKDYRTYVGRRVLVITSELTFSGTLTAAGVDTLTLEGATAVNAAGDQRPVDGRAIIPSLQVSWVQVP